MHVVWFLCPRGRERGDQYWSPGVSQCASRGHRLAGELQAPGLSRGSLTMEMNGLAHISILYPQFIDAAEWKAYAIQTLIDELATGYHQVNIRNYQLVWNLIEAYGETIPDQFRTVLEMMHAANTRLMMPDGRLPDLNDGNWAEVAPLMADAVRCYPEREDFKWAHTKGEAGQSPVETSLAFKYSGLYVMRTGWESPAVWALFDGGHLGFNHQHEDKLQLLIYAYGQLLLTEGGNYAYDTSQMRRYVLSTRAHNTIRVDGLDQNRKRDFRNMFLRWSRDEIIQALNTPNEAIWQISTEKDIAEAVYDEGYGPDKQQLVTHRRRVMFVKSPEPLFVVVDTLTALAVHQYEALWHFNTGSAEVSPVNSLTSLT